jgi:membrane protease YdiL (CAAX protease family)
LAFFITSIPLIKKFPENIVIITNLIIWYTILNFPVLFPFFAFGDSGWAGKLLAAFIIIILLIYKKIGHKQSFIYFCYNEENKPIIIKTVIIYLIVIFLLFGRLAFKLYENFDSDDLNDFVGFFLMFGILVGITEELCFRGLLYNKLSALYKDKKNISIIICSVLFGISHMDFFRVSFLQNIINFTSPFLLGILLNILYEKSKNIIVPIMLHNIVNLVYYGILYSIFKNFFVIN